MTTVGARRAFAIGGPLIAALVTGLFALSYIVSTLLGFPTSLSEPTWLRLVGGVVVVLALVWLGWTFNNRNPANVIVSTYVTFLKALRRIPAAERAGRTEPLVVSGPQRYTRNPLYFGVVVMVFGWALFGGYSFVYVATLVLLVWFSEILIPFEERELDALFGEDWIKYSRETPMLVPFTKRGKRRNPDTAASNSG